MGKPWELARWELIDTLAQRYHVAPAVILAEDVSTLRGLRILKLAEAD